ncbi:MAG: histidine kinase [Acidobacteria bacterium]|nr:histidine kinase [Acidobacteriota bacterium]MBV9475452.1 histidine kinase [Acidobacteriota bacterium]
MSQSAASVRRPDLAPQPWRRLLVTFALALGLALLLRDGWTTGFASLLLRTITIALVALLMFTFFERHPRQLPRWIARWVLQVVSVGVAMPVTTLAIYVLSTPAGAPPFWADRERMDGFMLLTFLSILAAPWTALAALLRQREAFARHQALAFELQRSELERQALDARLHLLQAQVAPHFLFNTLANVQALVDAGSPQAAPVLRSLVAYLRAAVPLLGEPAPAVGREIELVRAYLELMHMRMPDRLQFALHVDDDALALRCPPTALLTLVENAVRHGIDPSEEGGRIDIDVARRGERCVIRVDDSGVGLRATTRGLGTGLTTLRERLALMFGDDVQLSVSARTPHGVSAEVSFPARTEVR